LNNNDISAGIVPKKTKATTTVVKGLDATRFFGLIAIIIISNIVGDVFDGFMKYFFIGFCIAVFFVLTAKSPTNPTQRFYIGLISFFRYVFRNKQYYGTHSKEYEEFERVKENAKNKKEKGKRKGKA